MRHGPVLVLTAALSACGGSGGSNEGTPADGSAVVRFDAQARALDAAAARLVDLDFTETLPATGSATYTGHLGATAVFGGTPVTVTAEVTLTARFEAGTIAGSFANASSADDTVSGSGLFEDGTIGPAGLAAGVTGTLARSGDLHEIAGTLRGDFLGPDARGLVGAVEAELRQGGTPGGRFDGEVWAER